MERKNTWSVYKEGIIKRIRTFGLRGEIYFFLENLSALLSAGMGISMALSSVREEVDSKRMAKILGELEEAVLNGSSFSNALEEVRVISPHMLSLIHLGEMSGRLNENLKVVILQNEKEQMFRSRVRSSLMYAAVVFTLSIFVGVGTAWFTLPELASFFNELDAELPLITQIIISIGGFLGTYGYIIVPIFLVGLLMLFYFLFSFPKTKFIGHSVLFHTPVVRRLIKQVEIARFGFLLGTMLEAGMPMSGSLAALPATTTFLNYRKFYYYLEKSVNEGNSLQKSFSAHADVKKLFPSSVRQMIAASEQSGSLPETMIRVGKMYETKVETTAKNIPIILEPLMLILIGVMVAVLALGTILPIYNLGNVL